MGKKEKIALSCNIVLFLLVIVGSVLAFGEIYIFPTQQIDRGGGLLKFFTVQSNLFGGVTSLLYVIFLLRKRIKGKSIPVSIHVLRFVATIDLLITFLVVALFLGFIVADGYLSLFVNANFLFHFLIPVLNVISFLFFEKKTSLKFWNIFVGLAHLDAYAVFYFVVAFTHFHDGHVTLEYDWYAFAQFGVGIAIAFAVIVLGLGFLVAYALFSINNKISKQKLVE